MKFQKFLFGLVALLIVVTASMFVKRHVEPNSVTLFCTHRLTKQVRRLSSGECDDFKEIQSKVDPVLQRSELKSAEERWRKSNYSEYQFTYSYRCFCFSPTFGPLQIAVKDRKVTRVSLIAPEDTASNPEIQTPCCEVEFGETVDNLFDLIRRHLGEFDFSATYDKKTGFPLDFYTGGDSLVGDDEFGFQTKDFSPTM